MTVLPPNVLVVGGTWVSIGPRTFSGVSLLARLLRSPVTLSQVRSGRRVDVAGSCAARRSGFTTFAVALRGSPATKSYQRGRLNAARRSRHQRSSSSAVTSPRATTTALTASPQRSSGTPITAHSTTAG